MQYHTTSATIVGCIIGRTWGGSIAQQEATLHLSLGRLTRDNIADRLATALRDAGDFSGAPAWSADTELHVTRKRVTATGFHSHVRIVPLMASRYAAHPVTEGFIEAMEFADMGEEGQPPKDAPFSPNLTTAIGQYCGRFIMENCEALAGFDSAMQQRIGHDLWFTQAGHGCGFWESDRRAMYGRDQADEWDLWAKVNRFGDIYLGDNGMVYHG